MFNLMNIFKRNTKDDILNLLKISPELLNQFETAYKNNVISNINNQLLEPNTDDISEYSDIINKIVNELVDNTHLLHYDGKILNDTTYHTHISEYVTIEDLEKIPIELRPQLTGKLMSIDVNAKSYEILLTMYKKWLDTNKLSYYQSFRQGLDLLDLDLITYEMLSMNQNSISYWLPKILLNIDKTFFNIPKTKIIKVPMPILQLTRKDYGSLTPLTKEIVNQYCKRVFNISKTNDLFIKTGTYSNKFDFRNTHIFGNEIDDIGEYFLYIQYTANRFAQYDLSRKPRPSIYGVSTTNDWCVREYIKDNDNMASIYYGLPLHTEYRIFVDFDTQNILSVCNYWDKNILKEHFAEGDKINYQHDYITFSLYAEKIQETFEQNKNKVSEEIKKLIQNVNLQGQWSIDIMQNKNDFWIIDMAIASTSAYKETIPEKLRKKYVDNWLPLDIANNISTST